MNLGQPKRLVELTAAAGAEAPFAIAVNRWMAAEQLVKGVRISTPGRMVVELNILWHGDAGPLYGTPVKNDRARVVKLMRQQIPAELIAEAVVEGRSWTED